MMALIGILDVLREFSSGWIPCASFRSPEGMNW
jgi:hypothetical protein